MAFEFDLQHWYELVPDHSDVVIVMLSRDVISKLINKEDVILVVTQEPTYPAFIRLTSRSPKDLSENYDFDCKANCLSDAIRMLHASSRCQEDLQDYLDANLEIGLVIKPFDVRITLANELRVFVYKGKLVAVSAVDEPNNKVSENTLLKLREYIDGLHDLNAKFPSWVGDICHTDDSFIFIEVNPYDSTIVDSFLFDWDEDKHILYNDDPPLLPSYRWF